jgi:leucyl aminopeptidase (aminopeptidase T)
LNLPYNTAKAPFVAEIGNFDGVHEYAPNDELQNISYINIPGGEIYGTPYPFKKATGKFSAEGITFNVVDGLLINIEISKKVNKETLSTSQQELIARVNARNQGDPYYPYSPLPIAELGIGFYKQTDVKTYSDSSILSAEKTGPHIAFGHGFKSEEEEEIKNLSGKFYHADFVLDHPVIESTDENGANRQVFYHIIPNGI